MCVVPADEIDGGDTARQVLTGDVQHAIGLRADGVDHGVVALGELAGLDVFADDHIAEEAEAGSSAVFSNCLLIDLILG